MTNLLLVLPDFDIGPFTHLLPSLERSGITTIDLLSLDALDVAKRARVPTAEVRTLAERVVVELHKDLSPRALSLRGEGTLHDADTLNSRLVTNGSSEPFQGISTLDDQLDTALEGGVRAGCITEFVGERSVTLDEPCTTDDG